jgi:hypothetical protein
MLIILELNWENVKEQQESERATFPPTLPFLIWLLSLVSREIAKLDRVEDLAS